ncbi:hypothetical protein BDW60DRAFT_192981 [Aspergillus nidulans var. acristatus]
MLPVRLANARTAPHHDLIGGIGYGTLSAHFSVACAIGLHRTPEDPGARDSACQILKQIHLAHQQPCLTTTDHVFCLSSACTAHQEPIGLLGIETKALVVT